jgi:Asp-tRNA(Asn)/Glu-tRNA(Gln) amidotransferase A subunit family amidase
MAAAFEASAGTLARAGARVTDVNAPSSMDEIIEAADVINDYETYRTLAYERTHHASLLSTTLTGKLEKAAGVTRERYLAALQTMRACRSLLDELFVDLDVMLAPSATGEAPAGLTAIGPTGSLDPAAFQQMWTLLTRPRSRCRFSPGPPACRWARRSWRRASRTSARFYGRTGCIRR